LITGIIKDDVAKDRFSFLNFYARRGRRLLPALFAVVAATSIAGFLMLSPNHLQSFAGSAISAVLGVSNILFWHESDYFDLSARLKPLLHTWTLSLEWQFYVVWPAFLAFALSIRGRRFAPAAIGLAGGISLATGLLTHVEPVTLFYQMPFRIFEFAIGALLVWTPRFKRSALAELSLVAGLALIAFAVFKFDGKAFYGPLAMLVPTSGAGLAILGGQFSYSGLILTNPIAAYLGRISYSIYLVHWPLIVFTEYYFFRGITRHEAVMLFLFSIALGAVLHHTIERPFHQRQILRKLPRYAGIAITSFAALAIAIPALITAQEGLPWRVDDNALGLRYDNTNTRVSKEILGHLGCTEPCVFGKEDGPKILVIGDSHVDHFTKTLDRLGGTRYRFYYAGAPSCFNGATLTARSAVSTMLTEMCQKSRKTLMEWLITYKYEAVIVGQRWVAYTEILYRNDEHIRIPDMNLLTDVLFGDIADLLRGFGGPVIFVGYAPTTNTACYARPNYLSMTCPVGSFSFSEYDILRNGFARFTAKTNLNVHFMDVAKIICPNDQCATTDAEGHILYTDSDHLSIYGAALIVPKLLSIVDGAS
jgi:peptidoglycan/LPS O-acetylase OafA/YrhL